MEYVIYHKDCNDGFGAAWCFYQNYKERQELNQVEFIPAMYGSQPPEKITKGDLLYIVDFSYPKEVLLDICRRGVGICLLDHHKTSYEDLKGFTFEGFNSLPIIIFDMQRSGAMMAWDYLYPEGEAPDLIKYIQDRDMWKFNLPYSKEYHAALSSYPRDFAVWDELAGLPSSELIKQGEHILRFVNQQVTYLCSKAQLTNFMDQGEYEVPVVNTSLYQSELGDELCRKYKTPFSAMYYNIGNKRRWSLRSIGDFDVGLLAKKFENGGGHKNAAGFEEELGVQNTL